MKKSILMTLAALSFVPLTETIAQNNIILKDKKMNFKMNFNRLSSSIINSQNINLARGGDDQTLAENRRIIRQEFFEDDTTADPSQIANFGYVGNNYGLQFKRNYFLGFPLYINSSDVNSKFFSNHFFEGTPNLSMFEGSKTFYAPYSIGSNVLADTITFVDQGENIYSNYTQRNSNKDVINWSYVDHVNNYIEKTENIYTNGIITKINSYDENNVLYSTRKLTYNATNSKVLSDTLEYYYNGSLESYEVFNYFYNTNEKLSKLHLFYSESPEDSSVINFTYYANNNQLKQTIGIGYEGSNVYFQIIDSVAYNSAGHLNYYLNTQIDEFDTMTYKIIPTFDASAKLDSVKFYNGDGVNEELDMYGKYYYNIDENPDSMRIFNAVDPSQSVKFKFYYENFNTTSVKKLVKNNDGFSIFPNPIAGNHFNIESKNELKNKNAQITLLDIKGNKIFSTSQAIVKGSNKINIPVNLASGIYFVEIIADNMVNSQRILKQ